METYPIKFFLLNKNELVYEVLIRGEEPASTVLELRKQINKLTPIIPTSDICESGIEPDVDISGASISLSELLSRVKNLEDKFDNNLFERTRALCNHLYHRIKRLDVSDTKYADKIKSLIKHITTLSSKLDTINKSANPTSCEPVVDVVHQIPPSDNPPHVSIHCDRSHISDLQKLKYNGKSCVHAFIQRVKEYSTARNIPSSKLLAYATEIFTGDALHWYRSIRTSVSTWDELVAVLVEDFSQFDYDYRLLSEIRQRTQGDSETITIYFAKMIELFSRLSKGISEQEKLEILLHNIRPCYASVLASNSSSINSIDSLKTICKNFEKIQSITSQFKEPPRVTGETLAPDLAFSKFNESNSNKTKFNNQHRYNKYNNPDNNSPYTKTNFKNQHPNNNFYHFNKKPNTSISAISQTSSNTKTVFCPRCRNSDHPLSQCNANRYPICFKCGTKNVKYPDCPKCHTISNSKN